MFTERAVRERRSKTKYHEIGVHRKKNCNKNMNNSLQSLSRRQPSHLFAREKPTRGNLPFGQPNPRPKVLKDGESGEALQGRGPWPVEVSILDGLDLRAPDEHGEVVLGGRGLDEVGRDPGEVGVHGNQAEPGPQSGAQLESVALRHRPVLFRLVRQGKQFIL